MKTSGQPAASALERPRESVLGIGYALLVSAEQTGGAYEVMKFVVPAGNGPPPHRHAREDECFYLLDGEFEITLGDRALRARAGDCIHLPRGVPHAFQNVGESLGSFLCWVVPGNLSGFFDAFKRDWPADMPHPPAVTGDDVANLLAAAEKYGIEILAAGEPG
ncbi:MAG: cupin domain-containing protein [Planctomycetales bacterium]